MYLLIKLDLRHKVMYIDDRPFLFTASLRDNIDPFGRFTDEEIKEALAKVGVWDELIKMEDNQTGNPL